MADWQHLLVLLKNTPSHAESMLQRPCHAPLPDEKLLDDLLLIAADKNLAGSMARHVLSSLGTGVPRDDCAAEIPQRLLISVFPGLQLPPVGQMPWLVLPLPVVQSANGKLVHVLAGLLPTGRTVYASGHLSPESRSCADLALKLFTEMHPGFTGSLVLIPLLKDNSPSITGGSLGLPLALALHLLHTRRQWPEGVYASGCLNPEGKILPVEGLVEKSSVCHKPRCFLFAGANAAEYSGTTSIKQVATLAQAFEFLECILLEEDPEKAALFFSYLHSSRHFLEHFHEIPPGFLRHDKSRRILEEIKNKSFTHLSQVTDALQRCLQDPSRAALLIALYDEGQQFEQAAIDDVEIEMKIFAYSLVRIAHANHIGDTAAVASWKEIQHRHSGSITSDDRLHALNLHFVAERFNRFTFRIDIPPSIADLLDKIERANEGLCDAKENLGAMYGTLCQNFGFCGPGYLAGLLEYKEKAVHAFNRKFQKEARRLENYEFYGWLEAGEKHNAAQALNRYLELPETAEVEQWLRIMQEKLVPGAEGDLYKVSAILRGLVELDTPLRTEQLDTMHRLVGDNLIAANRHPWQLIFFNLARLLAGSGQQNAGVVCLEKMIAVCNLREETMQAMALLAYAELHIQGLADNSHYQAAKQLLEKMQHGHFLDPDHFAPLYQPIPLEEKLQKVAENRKQFFPFTYR